MGWSSSQHPELQIKNQQELLHQQVHRTSLVPSRAFGSYIMEDSIFPQT